MLCVDNRVRLDYLDVNNSISVIGDITLRHFI